FQLEQNTQTKNIDSICIAKIKMLASTMHFSNNTHPQPANPPPAITTGITRPTRIASTKTTHTSVFPQNPDSVLAASNQSPGKITQPPPASGQRQHNGVFDVSPYEHTPTQRTDAAGLG
ncbi:hypothetical protein, partial [Gordonia polyisoprenivorans]